MPLFEANACEVLRERRVQSFVSYSSDCDYYQHTTQICIKYTSCSQISLNDAQFIWPSQKTLIINYDRPMRRFHVKICTSFRQPQVVDPMKDDGNVVLHIISAIHKQQRRSHECAVTTGRRRAAVAGE